MRERLGGRHPHTVAYVLLTFAALFWAGNAIVGRMAAIADVPPLSLSFWRWAVGLAVLAPFGLRPLWRQRRLYRGCWPFVALLALLSVTAYNTCQYVALNYTTAVNVGVVGAFIPAAIFSLTWAFGHERAGPAQVAGLAVATAGVLLVVSRGTVGVLLSLDFNVGDLIMLVAAASWAMYSVMLRRLPPGLDPLGLMTAFIALGLVGIAPFYAWDLAAGRYLVPDRQVALIVAYAGVFPSVLSYLFWNTAVGLAGANRASLFMNLPPLFIAVLAMALLGEPIEWFHVAAMGLIFLGIYLATARRPAHGPIRPPQG